MKLDVRSKILEDGAWEDVQLKELEVNIRKGNSNLTPDT